MPAKPIERLIFSGLAAAVLTFSYASAQADERPRQPIVSVIGEGHASVAPNIAMVTLSVVKDSKTAQDALAQNNKAMGAVLETLKNAGVAEKDLQTSGFSVQPEYSTPPNDQNQGKPPQLSGYRAINSVTVRVRDLSKLGSLIDQAVALGVNQGGDIQFLNDKADDTIAAARRMAVADAMTKARALAEAAGVKLGPVLEISENSTRPQPRPMMRAAMMKLDSAVPLQSGENEYDVTVNVTWALSPQ